MAKVSGKVGGFKDKNRKMNLKKEGEKCLKSRKSSWPNFKKAVKIATDFLPNYYLSEEDDIILCGKIDWLEYLEDSDSVHIIDFKTEKTKRMMNHYNSQFIYFLQQTHKVEKLKKLHIGI